MNNKMVLNIMIAYFVILSIVLVYQLTRLNDKVGAVPSNNDAVQAEDRLNDAVVFYNESPVILSNKQQMLLDKTNPSYTPFIKNNIAYLPVSFYSTVYGANVSSNKSETSATIRLNNKALVISPDETVIIDNSNEKKIKSDLQPIIHNNTVYVPCEIFAEAYHKEVYVYGDMGILSNSEFTEEDNIFLNGLVSQVNDLPYVVNEDNLKIIANITSTDDIFANVEKKIKEFKNDDTVSSVNVLSKNNSSVLVNDGNNIYYGGTGRVEVLSSSDGISKIGEIPTPLNFTAEKLVLNNGKLIVIGNNFDTKLTRPKDIYKGNVSTDVYVYDVTNPQNIHTIKSYSVSGYYQNAEITEDYVYLLSKNTVYGLYNNDRFNPPAYYDSTFGGEQIDFNAIQYFPELGSDDVSVVSVINIEDTTHKPYVKSFVGAGADTYLCGNNFYISKERYTAFEDYENIENNCLYRYTFTNGVLNPNNKTIIKGSLVNSKAISEDNGYCRLVTKYTDSKNNNAKVCNVYVLNNNLEICGQANQVANDDDISSVVFSNKDILLMPDEIGGNIYLINIENPTMPQGKGAFNLSKGNLALYAYDESTVIAVDAENDILKLSMYDLTDLESPVQLFSQELGNTQSITTPLFDTAKGFLFDAERNVMVVPVKITGENVFEGAYVYNVYKDEGINRIGTVSADGLTADCITKGKLVMFSNDKAMVSDLNDVQLQTTVEFTQPIQ